MEAITRFPEYKDNKDLRKRISSMMIEIDMWENITPFTVDKSLTRSEFESRWRSGMLSLSRLYNKLSKEISAHRESFLYAIRESKMNKQIES